MIADLLHFTDLSQFEENLLCDCLGAYAYLY